MPTKMLFSFIQNFLRIFRRGKSYCDPTSPTGITNACARCRRRSSEITSAYARCRRRSSSAPQTDASMIVLVAALLGLPRLDTLVLLMAVQGVVQPQDVMRHLLSRNPVTSVKRRSTRRLSTSSSSFRTSSMPPTRPTATSSPHFNVLVNYFGRSSGRIIG